MGDPRVPEKPTLQSISVEVVSAMSALNMPTPEACPREYVRHAYQHLMAAAEQLSKMTEIWTEAMKHPVTVVLHKKGEPK